MSEMSRREFVAGAVSAVAVSLTVRGALGQATKPSSAGKVPFDAGEVKGIKEGFTDTFATANHVILVRKEGKIYAISSVCTHQGGTLKVNGEQLRCVKHGALFDAGGDVKKGPAKQALARYGISIKEGHVWVDPNKIILPGEFDKDGAFIAAV